MGKDKKPKPAPEQVTKLRQRIKNIHNYDDAIKEVAALDGCDSLPVVIQIVEDIKKIQEKNVEDLLKEILGNLVEEKLKYKKEAKDLFQKYARHEHSIAEESKSFILSNAAEIKSLQAKKFVDEQVESIFNKSSTCKEVLNKHPKVVLLKQKLASLLAINYLYVRYDDMDFKQRSDVWEVAKNEASFAAGIALARHGYKRIIPAPLELMSLMIPYLEVDNETTGYLAEWQKWIKGIFDRGYNVYPDSAKDGDTIKKDKEGNYLHVPGDEDDTWIYNNSKFCKYSLSFICHLAVHDAIAGKIPDFKAQERKEEALVSFSNENPQQEKKSSDVIDEFITLPSENKEPVANKKKASDPTLFALSSSPRKMPKPSLRRELSAYANGRDNSAQSKIAELGRLLKKPDIELGLEEAQMDWLKERIVNFDNQLNAYETSNFTTHWMPIGVSWGNWQMKIAKRPHEDVVKNAREACTLPDRKAALLKIYDLWQGLLTDRTGTASSLLQQFLEDFFDNTANDGLTRVLSSQRYVGQ